MEKKLKVTQRNLFFDLKPSIRALIYSFDSTFRDKYDECLKHLPRHCQCIFDPIERFKPLSHYQILTPARKAFLSHDCFKMTLNLYVINRDQRVDTLVIMDSCLKHAYLLLMHAVSTVTRLHDRPVDSMRMFSEEEIVALFKHKLDDIPLASVLKRPTVQIFLHVNEDFTSSTLSMETDGDLSFAGMRMLIFDDSLFKPIIAR